MPFSQPTNLDPMEFTMSLSSLDEIQVALDNANRMELHLNGKPLPPFVVFCMGSAMAARHRGESIVGNWFDQLAMHLSGIDVPDPRVGEVLTEDDLLEASRITVAKYLDALGVATH